MKLNKDNELCSEVLLPRDKLILAQNNIQLLVIHKYLSIISRNDILEARSGSMDALIILALERWKLEDPWASLAVQHNLIGDRLVLVTGSVSKDKNNNSKKNQQLTEKC